MSIDNATHFMMNSMVGAIMLFVIAVIFLVIFLLNKNSKAYFIYYAIVLAIGGGMIYALGQIVPIFANAISNEYATYINPLLTIIFNKSKTIGLICLGLAAICIVLFILLKKEIIDR